MIGAQLNDLKVLWNSQAIMTPAEKFQSRLLFQFGSYCRNVQRNSIKKANRRRAVSQAGEPPVYHEVQLPGGIGYKGTIFYAVDLRNKSVSIGPVLLSRKAAIGGRPPPEVLEHGGVAYLVISRAAKVRRRHISETLSVRPINVRARPSAGPAFRKTVDKKLPALIAGGIMREV
jgi:hypothetical protein